MPPPHYHRQNAQYACGPRGGPESIRYKCRMIRLRDEQWERIRMHFPEEHFARMRTPGPIVMSPHGLAVRANVQTTNEETSVLNEGVASRAATCLLSGAEPELRESSTAIASVFDPGARKALFLTIWGAFGSSSRYPGRCASGYRDAAR